MKKSTSYLLFFIFLIACDTPVGYQPTNLYFDVPSVLADQINRFKKNKIHITKTTYLDKKWATNLITNPDWDKEMQYFLKIDLNKPAYAGMYTTVAVANDSLIVNLFNLKKKHKAPVKYVKTFFTRSRKLYKINAELHTHNFVFDAKKNLQMIFDTSSQFMILKKYYVKGVSGFKYFPTDTFEVNVTIQYP